MRKKSHISLAKHIVRISDMKGFDKHRKALYFGSILPDCKPSFLTTPHEITGTIDLVEKGMEKLTHGYKNINELSTGYFTRLGEVLHYVADYFTFPHNKEYKGSLKDHCVYEGELKLRLREYIKNIGKKSIAEWKKDINLEDMSRFTSCNDIFKYIIEQHRMYIEREDYSIEEDCRYIVNVCSMVAMALVHVCVAAMSPVLELKPATAH